MITLSARYAIKAIMHLARDDGWVGSEELARITGIPSGYLMKVLQRLAMADILRTQRGMHGGYRLLREASAISLWDIVQAIERPPTGHICQSCANCLGCGADQVLAAIEADVVRSLRAHDIGTMVAMCRDHARPAHDADLSAEHGSIPTFVLKQKVEAPQVPIKSTGHEIGANPTNCNIEKLLSIHTKL